jgi:hypothetical protein
VITCLDFEADWSEVERLEPIDPDMASSTKKVLNVSMRDHPLVAYLLCRLEDSPDAAPWTCQLEYTRKLEKYSARSAGFGSAVYVYYLLHEQTSAAAVRDSNSEDYYEIGRSSAWREFVLHTVNRYFRKDLPRRIWNLATQKVVEEN